MLALQRTGAQMLDTRDPAEFAAAHLAGSINIGLGGQYATWAGTMLDRERPIVDHRGSGPRARVRRPPRPHRLRSHRRLSERRDAQPRVASRPHRDRPSASARRWRPSGCAPARPLAVDVRTPREREQKHVAGSVSVPLNHLAERLQDLPKDRPLLVYCAGGYRSSIAASLLQRAGFEGVGEIAGGIAAWETAGLPVAQQKPTIHDDLT